MTLSGGSSEEMLHLLHDLLAALEGKSLRTLLVTSDKEAAGVLGGAPLLNSDILLRKRSNAAADEEVLSTLATRYGGTCDLILVMGNEGQGSGIIDVLVDQFPQEVFHHRPGDESTQIVDAISNMLERRVLQTQVWACILIGGYSSRMGRPKHLIPTDDGTTWLEALCTCLFGLVDQVVLAGRGEIPQSLAHVPRLVDIPEAKGPMAGILAAMRWNPQVSWIVSACDMPAVQPEAVKWLLRTRQPGVWGSVPHHPESGRFEPLLAHYDFRSRCLFEKILCEGNFRLSGIGSHEKIYSPALPQHLALSWQNCNTPEDLARLKSRR